MGGVCLRAGYPLAVGALRSGLMGGRMGAERVEIHLPSAAAQVRQARQTVREAARRWHLPDDVADDLALATSELVTNAVVHARSQVRLAVSRHPDCIRLEVEDDHPQYPALSSSAEDAAGGRGLQILRAISTSWGVDPEPRGKKVWAELPLFRL